jgi:lysophospholipase
MKIAAIDRRAHPAGAVFSTWAAPDGWALRRMDWAQPAGIEARGSLLWAGGRGDFIEKYLEPLTHWHRRGWNVTSFDWRGQGESRGTIKHGHLQDFAPLIEDAGALVDEWLCATPDPHVLIGHSMGGHLALRLIAERAPAIDAAVLVAPMIGFNKTPVPPWIGRRIVRLMAALGWQERPAWKHNERPAPPGSTRQSYLTSCADRYSDELWWRERHPGFDLGPPSWGWLDAAFRSMRNLTPDMLRRVHTPILILGAAHDRLVSPTAIHHAARLLPNAELHIYPRAAHEILRESDPVRLDALARIDGFLDRNAPA